METKPAEKILDVPPEKRFWVNNGPILKNPKELLTALRKMKKETFSHHVNKEKNDFSKWVEEVFENKELAEEIRDAKTKRQIIKTLKQAVNVT